MEEFKIIKLPEKQDTDTEDTSEPVLERKVDDDYRPPKKRYIFLIALIVLVIVAIMVIRIVTTYSDYEVEKSWDRNDSLESNYCSFNNNLIKYSADGIFYTKYDGTLIWNYTYDMINPNIDFCDKYIVVYDKKGTEVDVFSTSGYVNTITTTTPVIEAQVASQGTVALLLQENTTSYIQMYDDDGSVLVSGEVHPENRGYPVSMALSSDATRLLLSIINVKEGEVSTDLVFYDFTSAGKKEEDNIVASYSYIGTLIPKVDYVKNDKAIAFCNNKIVIFNNNLRATIAKEISVPEEMKSIFYNDTHFGYVCETALESGEVVNQLNVYNLYGFRWMSKQIDSYDTIDILDNSEIYLKNGNEVSIYNLQGFRRFNYAFDEGVYNIIPGSTAKRYYVIGDSKTQEIYIK
ncbi:MAG: DUF5711 family protein [Pseudobutyrivibrio sp.]|nr:DUF5711 family protein [Pseudobutyrivibrio sp.]